MSGGSAWSEPSELKGLPQVVAVGVMLDQPPVEDAVPVRLHCCECTSGREEDLGHLTRV